MGSVPDDRIESANHRPVNPHGDYILYWMTAFRRLNWNFSLERSLEWARELRKPLVILEALRCGYRWASDRLHRFVLEGMADNQRRLGGSAVFYYPYVEPQPGAGKGLLAALGTHACVVVTDEFPCFFLPRMVTAAARQLPVCLEKVDSNGLLPLRATNRVFLTAHSFRRFFQLEFLPHFFRFPAENSLAGAKLPRLNSLPTRILRRWPPASPRLLAGKASSLSGFPIDHSVGTADIRGGSSTAVATLKQFLKERLPHYAELRNHPDAEATSGLSPYLHFGHLAAHQVFRELMERARWSPKKLGARASGSRTGWWGVSQSAEAFLDQFVIWRELGFNLCAHHTDYDAYDSLPGWARETLADHAADGRPRVYSVRQMEAAKTHDPLWNAAQTQLAREGRLHNYLRMLWGKKILEWSRTPQQALKAMIELNNKYALDGRDPNSYSGIFWCLGRYDRPWGPERPVFGKVRYMSSENTRRKLQLTEYLKKYAS